MRTGVVALRDEDVRARRERSLGVAGLPDERDERLAALLRCCDHVHRATHAQGEDRNVGLEHDLDLTSGRLLGPHEA